MPRGYLGYLYPPVGFLVSLELLGFPNKVLVSKKACAIHARGTMECLLFFFFQYHVYGAPPIFFAIPLRGYIMDDKTEVK